jgi:ribosomal protein S3AE
MTAVKNKIKELESDKILIQFAETNLTKDFIKTLKKMNELIDSIEKN